MGGGMGGGVMRAANHDCATTMALGAGGAGGAELGSPWEFRFSVAFAGPAPAPGGSSYCQFLLGDETGALNMLYFGVGDTYATTHEALACISDEWGIVGQVFLPWAPGVRRQVMLQWDGAQHRVWVDGQCVLAGVLRNPSGILRKVVSFYILGDASAAGWRIFDFQYSLTGPGG